MLFKERPALHHLGAVFIEQNAGAAGEARPKLLLRTSPALIAQPFAEPTPR
jgi:hypothetical protein